MPPAGHRCVSPEDAQGNSGSRQEP